LPRTRASNTQSPSGTVLQESQERGGNLWLVIGVSIVLAIGVGFALSRANNSRTATADPKPTVAEPTAPTPTQPPPTQPLPSQSLQPTTTTQPAGPDPQQVANDIDAELKKQRLWGTVAVTSGRIDIRSGACDDKAMKPLVDTKVTQLHAAGLTKLRCLTQSGGVVFERNL
jgi:hypothetical protein